MKEIKLSFDINLTLKQYDVHWIEEQLLQLREDIFLDMLHKVLREIEAIAVRSQTRCEECGELLVRNGHEFKQIRTLVGALRYRRIRLRCLGYEFGFFIGDDFPSISSNSHPLSHFVFSYSRRNGSK